jgi:hypothetical protein
MNREFHKTTLKLKTTLASSGLLLPELSVLVSDSEGDATYTRLRSRVVDDNILSKPSVQSRQKIWTKLFDRYKFDVKDDFFLLWWNLLIAETESYDLAQLATLRWAQFDMLLRFLWNEIYLARNKMELPVQSQDIIGFIRNIKGAHSGKKFFLDRSENVQIRIAQHFLLLLRECGAAKGKRNKNLVPLPVGKNASRYAVHLAKQELPGSHEILGHWALRWWGGNSSKADEILRQAQLFD